MKGGELMFMPKHMNHSTQGFTLMELLIVIGIIGILAVGLLAAVDPIEQLRKGRDTTKKNTAVEVANANARYFGATGATIWDTATPIIAFNGTLFSILNTTIPTVVIAGELKAGFQQGVATVAPSIN